MYGILVFFHCESNTGYAIGRHEYTFSQMALQLVGSYDKIHYGYPSIKNGKSPSLPDEVTNIIEFDSQWNSKNQIGHIVSYIKNHNIKIAFGFDQPVHRPMYKHLRNAGVKHIVSYWGAPMSSINSGLKLFLKKLEIKLSPHIPDLFIFQSEGMRQTAVNGRGIPHKRTHVINSGVDISVFKPLQGNSDYAHKLFNIPAHRKIIYYSGHMEERKGVHVIIKAAVLIGEKHKRDDIHFLIFGNVDGQEKRFDSIYIGTAAEKFITFGGYRRDVHKIMPCAYAKVLATTGWDSLPMSTLESAACGLPVIVSDLLGVNETIVDNHTGFLFEPGNADALASKIISLVDNPKLRDTLGKNGRARVEKAYTRELQIKNLAACLREFTV